MNETMLLKNNFTVNKQLMRFPVFGISLLKPHPNPSPLERDALWEEILRLIMPVISR